MNNSKHFTAKKECYGLEVEVFKKDGHYMAGWTINTGKAVFSIDSFKTGCEGMGMILKKTFANMNNAKTEAFRQLCKELDRYLSYPGTDKEKSILNKLRRQLELEIYQLELFD